MPNWKRFIYLGLVSVLIAAAILLRYFDPLYVRVLRQVAFDSYQRLAPETYDPNLPVRIVDIDEYSLSILGQWPWPRTVVRDLLLQLTSKGAAAVAFDVLFAEPDRTSVEELTKRLPAEQARLILAVTAGEPTNDQHFATALKQTPSVMAVALGDGTDTSYKSKAGFAIAGEDPRPFLPSFTRATSNLTIFNDAARGVGAFNWIADRDQIVRRVALVYRLGEDLVPSLAAESLRVAQGASTYVLKASNASGETAHGQSTGLNNIRIGQVEVPTDGSGAVYLRFRHFNRSSYISAAKVLSGDFDQSDVEGRIILVGTSASGLLDLRATPLEAAIPGVDIQAQVVEQLFTGRFLTRPDYALAVEELVILVLGIALAILLPRASARIAVVIGLLTVLLVAAGGWIAFRYASMLFDPSYPAVALGGLTASITAYVFHGVEAQRAQIRTAFGRYLAPTVVEEIVAHPERLKLGGEERELTLMFCDVRNFTSISENLTATELAQFINELLTPLSELVLEHRGTIDKYMGDAIMAFWNAPVSDPDHRAHACRAAVNMILKMTDLNIQWQQRAEEAGRPFKQVKIGIGLNTGQCCVGNLGSTFRFDYSVIGDQVNVTSRLEGLTKLYGVPIILSQNALAPGFEALELDTIEVKGRTRATQIYTLIDVLGVKERDWARLRQGYEKFLVAYRNQEWDAAHELLAFCRILGVTQLEACYSLFESRLDTLPKMNLPSDWDGSFAMTEK